MKTIEGEITVHFDCAGAYKPIPIHQGTYKHTHTRKHIHNGFVWKQMQWSEKSKLIPTNNRMNEIANHFTILESFFLQCSWNKIKQYHNKKNRREKYVTHVYKEKERNLQCREMQAIDGFFFSSSSLFFQIF